MTSSIVGALSPGVDGSGGDISMIIVSSLVSIDCSVFKINVNGSGFSSLVDVRFAVKGQINEFLIECAPSWRGVSPSIMATIDIDVRITDTKHQRTIWKGKIESYQRMGPNRGIFTGTNKIFLFLNTVFSDSIEKAWVDYGMLNTLKSLDKKPFSK